MKERKRSLCKKSLRSSPNWKNTWIKLIACQDTILHIYPPFISKVALFVVLFRMQNSM